MDLNGLITAIGSVGFPIVACIYMTYVNNKQSERHEAESAKWTEAINDLKIAIVTLTEKLNK